MSTSSGSDTSAARMEEIIIHANEKISNAALVAIRQAWRQQRQGRESDIIPLEDAVQDVNV